MRTHQQIDRRSLALHRLVADKLRAEPARFETAKATLARWRATVCGSSQPYLEQWQQVMNLGMEAALRLALEDSERATALRQNSPFAGLLSNRERFAFLKGWSFEHEA